MSINTPGSITYHVFLGVWHRSSTNTDSHSQRTYTKWTDLHHIIYCTPGSQLTTDRSALALFLLFYNVSFNNVLSFPRSIYTYISSCSFSGCNIYHTCAWSK